ncbi:MAG: integrin [Comamonadaceae bacterium]|nr:MAG: integrin [Comamonadaceae bacterium]
MSYDVKTFKIGWDAVDAPARGGVVTYRVLEDIDGTGPLKATELVPAYPKTLYSVGVNVLLHERLNATYTVQACNTAGCSESATPIGVDVNKAIGYFKASAPGEKANFGWSIALSDDGKTLAVGAPGEGSDATGINGNQASNAAPRSGAVYVFTQTAGVWAQQAYLKASNTRANHLFGSSVDLSGNGNTLAVGAIGEDSGSKGINGDQSDSSAAKAGAAYVFVRGGTAGATWTQQAYVKAENVRAGDGFGSSVSLNKAGQLLAVGANRDDDNPISAGGTATTENSGVVHIFGDMQGDGRWLQHARVRLGVPYPGDNFGAVATLSGDGMTLAVGAPVERRNSSGSISAGQISQANNANGSVWVFTTQSTTLPWVQWSQQAYLTASNADVGDAFGYAVALSGDGNTLAVGARREDSKATGVDGDTGDNSVTDSGAVYVFSRNGTAWVQQAYLKASNTGMHDDFGSRLALSSDGKTLAVGANFEAGKSLGINGDQSQGDRAAVGSGAAYVFSRNANTWTQKAYLKSTTARSVALFGMSLALSGDGTKLVVGAVLENSGTAGVNAGGESDLDYGASQSGAAYMY